MDYWEETVRGGLDDAGITATDDQIDTVVAWVEGSHDNYGMAHGHDAIPNPEVSEINLLKAAHKKELEECEKRETAYRQSVATRRGVDIGQVYLSDSGEVIYG